ncbi:hypothetical protein EVAR_47879_1 [Eumeta japonica]|uniref:Uncharacterized protein n=1 Tax=Eumeta variegata TaxID=151549 RepID=A0A4C1YAI0_EUMVA|nr:hypothetical protein EVAR_47879_1 [Eumeta japonica]
MSYEKKLAVFKAKAARFESAAGLINSGNKNRLRARFDDFPEYRTQFVEAYEALLSALNYSEPEHEAVLSKVVEEQLVELLAKECRFLDNIPRDLWESSGNSGRRVTPEQRAGGNSRRIETPPPLRR